VVDKRFKGVSDVSAADTVADGTSYVNLWRPVWVKAGRKRQERPRWSFACP